MPDSSAAAFVGSHNLTGFALRGLNGEAGILLEGPVGASAFDELRSHIDESYRQAVPYDRRSRKPTRDGSASTSRS